MNNIFTDHPNSVGETYFQHMKVAFTTGVMMILGGLACTLHSIFPFLFPHTGSKILLNLTRIFLSRLPKDEPEVQNFLQFLQAKSGATDDTRCS